MNVSLADSTAFTCTASGFPVPVITWTYNGEEVRLNYYVLRLTVPSTFCHFSVLVSG